jgi:hypothetical protein
MSFLLRTKKTLCLLGVFTVLVTAVSAEEKGGATSPLTTANSSTVSGSVTSSATPRTDSANYLAPSGGEFSILGSGAPGDQVYPALSLNADGGVIAWEDNGIDRNGSGIGARRFSNSSFVTSPMSLIANRSVVGNQITPQVATLTNKSTVFVWQSMATGTPDVYARVMTANGVFKTIDLRLNTYIKDAQSHPAVAALADGTAVIVWQSAWQDGCPNGIYARKISATGAMTPVREFKVNAYNDSFNPRGARGNRRNPAVALLASGNFVVTWISEQQRTYDGIDVYARIFSPTGTPLTDDFRINSATNICADPQVAGLSDGGFTVVWSERDYRNRTNSWDIAGRSFMSDGSPKADEFIINTFRFGDQFQPKIAAAPTGCLVVWTSLGQDGSREGVFGQFLLGGSQVAGSEMMVNTTRVSQQLQPAVAWNGVDRFLVVWSGFVANFGFDLFGQAYVLTSP